MDGWLYCGGSVAGVMFTSSGEAFTWPGRFSALLVSVLTLSGAAGRGWSLLSPEGCAVKLALPGSGVRAGDAEGFAMKFTCCDDEIQRAGVALQDIVFPKRKWTARLTRSASASLGSLSEIVL